MTNVGSEVLSSPIVAYNSALGETLVYVATTAGLITAYDQATGLPVWAKNMGGSITSTPLAEGDYLWVAPQGSGRLYKLDAATGAVQCSASPPLPVPLYSSPTLATPPGGKATIYIGGMDSGNAKGSLTAVDEATCHIDFTSTPVPGPTTSGVWDPVSYGVDATGEPLVLFGTADPDSAIYAVDAVTGKLVWRYSTVIIQGDYDVGAGVTISAPGVNGFADGVAYGISKLGYVFAIDLTTGALIWKYDFGSPSLSTPALSGTNLVFGDGGGAICLNAVTGAVNWQTSVGSSVHADGSVAVVGPVGNQIVAYGDLDGTFRVLSLATGAQLYSYQTGSYISAGVAETDGNLIEASADGFLYDFAPGGGNPPAPSTVVTSPAPGSTVANPGGTLTVSGTASSISPLAAVDVAIQQNGTAGKWWDSVSDTWTPEPYPNSAALSDPGGTTTDWSMTVPTDNAGEGLVVYASAVDSDGVADISSEQSPATSSRAQITILPKASSPTLSVASRWVPMDGAIVVSGRGFGDGEAVSFSLNGLAVGTASANSAGVITAHSFTVPSSDSFGPQTLVASGERSGRPATSTLVYVTNSWTQAGENATHDNTDPSDLILFRHLSLYAPTYLQPTWSFNAGSAVTGSVDVSEAVVYLADADGVVDAVNVRTGVEKWSTEVSGESKIDTTPALVGNLVIVGSVNQRLYALSESNGKVVWTTTLGSAIESSPSAVGGVLYVGDDRGDVYALTASTGKVLWKSEAGGAVKDSPAVDTTVGDVVIGSSNGTVRALALSTGKVRWTYATGSSITSSTVILDGTVFAGAHDGTEYALHESTGKLHWKYATGASIIASATLLVEPVGTEPDVIVASGKSLHFLTLSTGVVTNTITEPDTIVGTAGAPDFVVSELANGDVEGARPLTGSPDAWSTSLPTTLASSPTIINGEVFVTGNDGTVECWTIPGFPAV
jgi:outer membrane protein assembly factor BamB